MMPVGFAHHGLTLTSPRDRIGKTFSGNERNESE
jgi:hypothetical protein